MLKNIKFLAAKIITKTPYFWKLGWSCVNHCSFLLPHDNSYWALKHFCTPNQDLFLDIGANCGISALSFRKINKVTPILSIEPNPLHQQRLSKLTKKIPSFSFLLLGAGNTNKEMIFYTPIYKGIVLHTFTATSKQQIKDAVQTTFGKKIANSINIKMNKTKITKIDELHINPTIIKIDTEGYENQVILGTEKTIQKMRPFLMIEACWSSYQDIKCFFTKHNYYLLSYNYKKDQFIQISSEQLVNKSAIKNIFAIPFEKISSLPVQGLLL